MSTAETRIVGLARWAFVLLLIGLLTLPAGHGVASTNNNNNNNNNNSNPLGTANIGTGVFFSNRAVGGVSIDADGVVQNIGVEQGARLRAQRLQALAELPGDLNAPTKLRKVSLRRLEQAIDKCLQEGNPLHDEMLCLGGLQEIRYVFLYPEQNDIVLAGFGEGWRFDAAGNLVGVTTGQPVLMLDDFLVALRAAEKAAQTGISCSIDPTQQGLDRYRHYMSARGAAAGDDIQQTLAGIEQSLGPQVISISGVPETSHFAQVLVAADYRMKRIAMALEQSPLRELPSYLAMSKGRGSAMPRWWLEPDFDPLVRDADGMAFEIPPARVKAMTEDDFLAANGQRQHSGKANPVAKRWADLMTRHYPELAARLPIFAELKNVMHLSVVAALITKEKMADKADCRLSVLLNPNAVQVAQLYAPREVPTQASFIRKGDNLVISASGGVLINSWGIAQRMTKDMKQQLPPLRSQSTAKDPARWWWN